MRELYPDIPWKSIGGMRDRLAHAYFGVDLHVVWSTAKMSLPELKSVIQSLLDRLTQSQ
ncbi:HepT-like ribonuclease domain-containing protein [Lyngbya confervoides]|uniref:HepT-like ribonuclease domain-containing protein n=1 Tax=Lyngbya confervoides TaxID=207921 RepID=UPI001408D421